MERTLWNEFFRAYLGYVDAGQRGGQAAYNAAMDVDRAAALGVINSNLDPYHDTNRLGYFLDYLDEQWKGR